MESEDSLRSIVDAVPECVKIVTADGSLLDINPAGLEMLGAASKDEVVGKRIYDLIDGEHREEYRRFNESVCRGNSGVLEFTMIDLLGGRHFMETSATPLPLCPEGEVAQLGITRDVTDRREAEHREEQERQRMALHVERTPLGVIEFTTDFKVAAWNPGRPESSATRRRRSSGNRWRTC